MFKKITRSQLENFLKKYSTNERVLDIGSGGSSYDKFFPNRLTVDIDPDRKPEIVADIHRMPFNDGEFNFVLCTEVIEHAENPQVAVRELYRVLKPGGTLVLSTRFVFPIHDSPNDFWRFTLFGMRKLFSDWEIIELAPETHTFTTIGVLLQRIGYQTKLKMNFVSKFIIFALAYIFSKLDFLITSEYGDIKKNTKATNILSSGYYICVKKPKSV